MTYIPIDGRPFAVSMGLRALNVADWIEIDSHRDEELKLKRELLEQHHGQVFASLPEGLQGSQETLALLEEHLLEFFPNQFPQGVESDESVHPLEAAARLVQEDLVVMSPRDGQWILTAACVCFPSRWDLTEKIGANLHEIHGPVPHYAERIGEATNTMFNKFTADRPVWRVNWTILDSPDLFQPSGELRDVARSAPQEGAFGDVTFFRTERQTLRVLPSGDVLFTIRNRVNSLNELARISPEFREHLGPTLESTSEQTRSYKGWHPMWEQLSAWSQGAI